MQARVPCFCCKKPLTETFDGSVNQPSDAVSFSSAGHYGSTVHDAAGYLIELNVCDDCLRAGSDRVLRVRSHRPDPVVEYQPWVVDEQE